MKQFLATCLLLVLSASCANMKQTITDTSVDASGKPVTKTIVSDSTCQGLGCSAHELAALEVRRQQVADDGSVARTAAEKGMPVQRTGTADGSSQQTGYTYGYGGYGYGNGYGQYGYTNPALMGYQPGRLPPLGGQTAYIPQPQPQAMQVVKSPAAEDDPLPPALEKRLTRIESDQTNTARKVIQLKKK